MATARVKSYAKMNITLDITGKKEGYHTLDSFVVSVDLYDLVVAKSRKDDQIVVRFHGLDAHFMPPDNNAKRAAQAFVSRFHTNGADIAVYRNIPAAAGLGGSSADVAGVLNAMKKIYKIDDEVALKELADSLGSDTGYMLNGGFYRMRGRGEQLYKLPVSAKMKMYFLLLCPPTGVSSAECYKRYDEEGEKRGESKTSDCIEAFLQGEIDEVGTLLSNDLYSAAKSLNPDVALAAKELSAFSPSGVNMTGSGSAVYALFPTKELRDWAKSRYTGDFDAFCLETVMPSEMEGKSFQFPFALQKRG